MKKIKYIIVFILSLGLLNSCLVDNDTDLDGNDKGNNFVSFEKTQTAIAAIADGEEYVFDIKVHLTGPTSMDVTEDLGITAIVDESSTAIEGTHYRIDNPTIKLTAENNHLVELKITMLTAGIATPLDKSPVLKLKLSNATGNSNVIANGKPIDITFSYACPSFLAGEYNVVVGSKSYSDVVTETGIGTYSTTRVGTWSTFSSGFGFEFSDVCGVITVPLHKLGHMYSNEIWGHQKGSVDENGIITAYYTIALSSDTPFKAVYTPKK